MIKQQIVKLLSKNPIIKQNYSGVATIFMLHRVDTINPNGLPANENMKVTPDYLDRFISELLNAGYDIISLDELYKILIEQKKVQKKIIFTFDDGYKDNLTNALPIFEKYQKPLTIYVTTSFPDNNAILWWYALEDIILEHNKVELSDGTTYKCETLIEKQQVFLDIRSKILAINQYELLTELQKLLNSYAINWQSYTKVLSLTWNDIKYLAYHPLVTIGGHTVNHLALNKLSEETVSQEIIQANQQLEKHTGKIIEHFAYPFGSQNEIGQREYDLLKAMKLKTVTTTRRGNIFLPHVNHLECLPRLMLTENFSINEIGKMVKQRLVTL